MAGDLNANQGRRRSIALSAAAVMRPVMTPVLVSSLGLLLSACASAPLLMSSSPKQNQPLLRPPKLKTSARVGLIAPGGYIEDSLLEKSVKNLRYLGFEVITSTNIRAIWGGYAGTVKQRVDDLHAMFADPTIDAIWAVRGGSGANALLPYLDYELIRANPKILIGYSDVTALLLAINHRTGLICFHGPVASSTFSDYSVANFKAVLMNTDLPCVLKLNIDQRDNHQVLRPGIAQGRLLGGNLSVLGSLIGTPYLSPLVDRLLFLEEISEAPYRIDRFFNQLQQVGLPKTAAVMLGVFVKCDPLDNDRSLTLNAVLQSQLGSLGLPSVYGYSFGHIAGQMTLPIGVMARLDTESKTLTLLESAVS